MSTAERTQAQRALLQDEFLEYIRMRHGTEQWVTVYESVRTPEANHGFFSALIPNDKVPEALNDHSWDLHIGHGMPGHIIYYPGGGAKERRQYFRYGDDDGIEPLVIYREFHHAMVPDYVEILEEFRHYHNLFHDAQANKYLRLNRDGDRDEVIIITENSVKIRLKELRQFLAVKEMHLALYFDSFRYSNQALEALDLKDISENVKDGLISYSRSLRKCDISFREDQKSLSRVLGKKLIPGVSKEKVPGWNDSAREQCEAFIVSVDGNGDPVQYTCDPDKLANYFGANPEAPHHLTPVFFRREVLTKYYANPQKFSVEDGYLRCGGLWGLRMDNNHEKHIMVFLGDLGEGLSHNEQLYWKNYNIPPDGKMSAVNFKRGFLAEFADPEKPDLLFKMKFEAFNEACQNTFGWPLFKPLAAEDAHFYTTLRVPLTDDPAELDIQSLALAKLLVDSLNEAEIRKQLRDDPPPSAKGITKLECWLHARGSNDYHPHISFLRNLYDLRHGAGHRKGEAYAKAAAFFGLQELKPAPAFENILRRGIALLDYIEQALALKQTEA